MCAHTPFPPLRGTTQATMKRKRSTLYVTAFLVLSMGYMRLQFHSSKFGPVDNCDSYINDTISSDSRSSSHMLAAEPPLQYPQHSTITCQLDETESDYDRRCHLENVCWDRTASTFVYFLDSTRPEVMPAVTLLNGKPRRISVQRKPGENKDDSEFLPLVERAGPIPLTNATFIEDKVFGSVL